MNEWQQHRAMRARQAEEFDEPRNDYTGAIVWLLGAFTMGVAFALFIAGLVIM